MLVKSTTTPTSKRYETLCDQTPQYRHEEKFNKIFILELIQTIDAFITHINFTIIIYVRPTTLLLRRLTLPHTPPLKDLTIIRHRTIPKPNVSTQTILSYLHVNSKHVNVTWNKVEFSFFLAFVYNLRPTIICTTYKSSLHMITDVKWDFTYVYYIKIIKTYYLPISLPFYLSNTLFCSYRFTITILDPPLIYPQLICKKKNEKTYKVCKILLYNFIFLMVSYIHITTTLTVVSIMFTLITLLLVTSNLNFFTWILVGKLSIRQVSVSLKV